MDFSKSFEEVLKKNFKGNFKENFKDIGQGEEEIDAGDSGHSQERLYTGTGQQAGDLWWQPALF